MADKQMYFNCGMNTHICPGKETQEASRTSLVGNGRVSGTMDESSYGFQSQNNIMDNSSSGMQEPTSPTAFQETDQQPNGNQWSHGMVLLLIELYRERRLEFGDPAKKKVNVWKKISQEMNSRGYETTGENCDKKFRSLKNRYKVIKDNNKSGRSKRKWEYYELLHQLLAQEPEEETPSYYGSFADMFPESGREVKSSVMPCKENTPTSRTRENMSEVVEVLGVGEIEVKPQLAHVTLLLSSQSSTFELCRASVDKRKPHVHQTLLKHKAQADDICETENIVRNDDGGSSEIEVQVTALLPTCNVVNAIDILKEKLGNSFTVFKIGYRHSCDSLSEARIKAGRKAAEEARIRATDMAAAVGSVLGPCIDMVEESCNCVATNHDKSESWNVDTALRQQETHEHTPVIICTTIRARFALLPYGVLKKKK
ncbi:hypothetical protein SK128_016451 [Halocaridina rubra]|uniref:Myb/SANT-like DNA-binding domain-containing protein n=1 Tax=Halocaridina rubra TaxID=373956 RepID=A0AAN8WS04_HALRR